MKKLMVILSVLLVLITVTLAQALPLYSLNPAPGQMEDGGPFIVVDNDSNFETFYFEYFDSINANTESLFEYSLDYKSTLLTAQKVQSVRVPEPGIIILLGLGLIGVAAIRRKS